MDSASGRSNRLESAISIFLLAILFLIAITVIVKQADFDIGRFGMDVDASTMAVKATKTGTGEKIDFDALVPSGFKKLSEVETYAPDTLYEKINGRAELYIKAGFVKLFAQRFVSESDDKHWFELFLYDMAAVKNAFSVYSMQKRPDVEILPFLQFGYKTSNALYFVHDKFYIELVGASESANLFMAMSALAEKLPIKLNVDKVAQIPELALFPQNGLVPGSAKLYLSNALGFDKLSDTYLCQYKIGDETVTAFLSSRAGKEDAEDIAKSYYKFLIDNSGKDKSTSEESIKTINGKVVDFYDTTEIVFSIGPFVGGIHEAKSQKSAESLASILINKLTEAAKTEKR